MNLIINYSIILFLLLSKSILSIKRIKRYDRISNKHGFIPDNMCRCDEKELERTNSTVKKYRMINSVLVPNKLIRSIVALYARDEPASIVKVFCTGTLIYSNKFLTAASCIDYMLMLRQEDLVTYVGAGSKHSIEDYFYNDVYEKKVHSWTRHPQYDPKTRKNNIALVYVNDYFFIDTSLNTIGYSCLYDQENRDFTKNKLYGLGFGNNKYQKRTKIDGTSELHDLFRNRTESYRAINKERPVNVDKASNETLGAVALKQIIGPECHNLTDSEICARSLNTKKIVGACPGDTGSPLFGKIGKKYAVLGIASRVVYDNKADQDTFICGTGHTIYYEYITKHLEFILKIVADSICEPL